MGLGLDPTVTPDLFQDKHKKPLPIESLNGTDKTAYLNIDLKIDAKKGKPVVPMTAVFAPDPSTLSGPVDVILWLHGDKSYWDNSGTSFGFAGETIQYYLKTPRLCRLRELILKSTKRNFLLVAPTLNDKTGAKVSEHDRRPGALQWDQDDAAAYLQQAVRGAQKHLGANVTEVKNIVLAAHSGGGRLQAQMAQDFAGKFTKMNEIWCFDSSYFGGDQLINWVLKGHSNPRLWVYSFDSDTAGSAAKVLEYTKPLPPEKPHRARTLGAKVGAMVGSAWHAVHATAHDLIVKTTTIDVLIDRGQKPRATDFFLATYGGTAGGHYESIGKYLTSLVNTSRNLT